MVPGREFSRVMRSDVERGFTVEQPERAAVAARPESDWRSWRRFRWAREGFMGLQKTKVRDRNFEGDFAAGVMGEV